MLTLSNLNILSICVELTICPSVLSPARPLSLHSDFDDKPPATREELYNLQHSVLYACSVEYGMGLFQVSSKRARRGCGHASGSGSRRGAPS